MLLNVGREGLDAFRYISGNIYQVYMYIYNLISYRHVIKLDQSPFCCFFYVDRWFVHELFIFVPLSNGHRSLLHLKL